MKIKNIKGIIIGILIFILLALNLNKVSNNKKLFSSIQGKSSSNALISVRCTSILSSNVIQIEFIEEKYKNEYGNLNVRLIGIKENKNFTDKELNYLKSEILNRVVQIKFDSDCQSQDNNGNILCYLYVDSFLFNKILLESGMFDYDNEYQFNKENMKTFIIAEKYGKLYSTEN